MRASAHDLCVSRSSSVTFFHFYIKNRKRIEREREREKKTRSNSQNGVKECSKMLGRLLIHSVFPSAWQEVKRICLLSS